MNMNIKKDSHNVGVIVARFQVNELTPAHKELIQTVVDNHPKVFIYLGLSPVRGTINNPFDFQPRKQMILEAFPPKDYPNITIGYIKDVPSDEIWSRNLDNMIQDLLAPNDTAVLYGSRDSFLSYYKGRFETRELVATRHVSGTEIRRLLAQKPQSDPLFRAGVIFGTFQRYPTVFSTVDIAVFDPKNNRLLLAKKPDEALLRFVGGFASPNDDSFEQCARRELNEETGLTVASLDYIGSYKIDDWRYRGEVDKIITHFYLGGYTFGCPKPADDISEVRWVDIDRLRAHDLVPQHRVLYTALIAKLEKDNLIEKIDRPEPRIMNADGTMEGAE